MRVPTSLTFIPDQSAAKGGHAKHQTYIVEVCAGPNGNEIKPIAGQGLNVALTVKRLPGLHDALWAIFADVKNRADIEQYRQLLVPQLEARGDDAPVDTRQNIREDFYEALTAYGMCLRIALASRSFFEDSSISEAQIAAYKRDLKFFTSLRLMARQDAQETVDFSAYEEQIRKLVDRYVVGEDSCRQFPWAPGDARFWYAAGGRSAFGYPAPLALQGLGQRVH